MKEDVQGIVVPYAITTVPYAITTAPYAITTEFV
jgi:hypothetical protein